MAGQLARLIRYCERPQSRAAVPVAWVMVVVIGYVDYSTGPYLSFAAFYLLPVALGTWCGSPSSAVLISVGAAGAWFLAELYAVPAAPHLTVPYWNAASRLAMFLFFASLLLSIRRFSDTLRQTVEERTRRLQVEVDEHRRTSARLLMLAHAVEGTAEMICITDLQDRLTFVNRAFQEKYGHTADEILGQSPAVLVSPTNPPGLLAEILEQTREGGWRGELLNRRRDGTDFPVYLSTSPVFGPDGEALGLMGVAQDITERQQAEARLRLLAAIVENAEDAILSEDPSGLITSWNYGAERIFGYTAEEAMGRSMMFLSPPEHQEDMARVLERLRNGERIVGYETVRRHKSGMDLQVSLTLSTLMDSAGRLTGVAAIERDISARKALEDELRRQAVALRQEATRRVRLEREMAELTTAEHHRIGRDLHDGLGQYIAGLSFHARMLAEDLEATHSPHLDHARRLEEMIRAINRDLRRLEKILRPATAEVGGLPAALRNLVAEIEQLVGLPCLLEVPETPVELEDFAALMLFRIAQEALNNAVKHAQACQVQVSLEQDRACTRLSIRDHGPGFLLQPDSDAGAGLRIMRYRAELIGAVLSIDSSPGKGCTVRCTFPRVLDDQLQMELPS